MSIVQKLSEGIVNRDMKAEGQALLSKWSQTGLLEGLQNEQSKQNMARLLENQAKELLREASSMGAGDVEGFAAVAFPIVRRVFAGLIANELVSVQPMSLPSGLIFFLDFTFGDEQGGSAAASPRMGITVDGTKSIYGGNQLAKGIVDGVSLVGATNAADLSGPYNVLGSTYSSPSGSVLDGTIASGAAAFSVKNVIFLDGTYTEAQKSQMRYDPDLLNVSTGDVLIVLDIAHDEFSSDADFNNLASFVWDVSASGDDLKTAIDNVSGISMTISTTSQIRRLTNVVPAGTAMGSDLQSALTSQAKAVRFYLVDTTEGGYTEGSTGTSGAVIGTDKISGAIKDLLNAGAALGSVNTSSNNYALEGNSDIPEIDIKVDSIAITAQTKKLKAKWTPELGQDLNAYHNLDAEVELTSILSEQIALEIDREILADLVNGATAGTQYWSRSPGLFVNKVTGAEIGQTSAAPDFTGTVSEWYETLIETINDVSAQIHRKTLRGGANFVVCSPEVANILEFTSGFRANVTADADRGDIGAVKTGSLSRKFDVMVDPYFPRNVILVGRKGNSFLESGYVYAPYVPLQVTPTIFGTEDFVPRKGVMTRYAKKMVRPDMYGLVIVRGLLGEAGATS
jgi:hypothetical protein